ncbi:hypothetical protein R6Z07F_012822 [Ovis aries]
MRRAGVLVQSLLVEDALDSSFLHLTAAPIHVCQFPWGQRKPQPPPVGQMRQGLRWDIISELGSVPAAADVSLTLLEALSSPPSIKLPRRSQQPGNSVCQCHLLPLLLQLASLACSSAKALSVPSCQPPVAQLPGTVPESSFKEGEGRWAGSRRNGRVIRSASCNLPAQFHIISISPGPKKGPEISHSGFCLDGWYPFHLLEREPPHQPWGLPPALAQGSSSEESACLSPGLVRNVPYVLPKENLSHFLSFSRPRAGREGPVWSTLLLTQLRSGVATVHERPTPCPSHPASSCRVREHGLLSVSAPHFLLEEAGEQSLVFQSPPGSGLSTDRGVGASCAPTRFLISQPPLAARLDGRMGPVGRPRSQRKEQAGAEAGDGDLDGLESRTAVGTLIDDAGVGAQRRQGSGELC